MNETKPWYLSRTIWASLVTVALALSGLLGLPVHDLDGNLLAEALVEAATALAGIAAVIGRLSARDRIG